MFRRRRAARPRRGRQLGLEQLETRRLLAADLPEPPTLGCLADEWAEGEGGSPWQNAERPTDVNADGGVTTSDALLVLQHLWRGDALTEGEPPRVFVDVNGDQRVTPHDALLVLGDLWAEAGPDVSTETEALAEAEVETLLERAAAASSTENAIIAVVDRNGRILGVRTEADVVATFAGDVPTLSFAIDGAVAKARTAAFFAANSAPLTSRTVRFISQSTITQREVESNPSLGDFSSTVQGPGFVAPIGVGGHFPPEIAFTPPVDLVNIEHQSRDSRFLAGPDRVFGTADDAGADGMQGTADDLMLAQRFNIDPMFIPMGRELYFPEAYGVQSGRVLKAQSRGVATLPGGIPIYKKGQMVGGIGVFFPGPDGFATHEQDFVPAALNGGRVQSENERTNAPQVLESEWIAYAAIGGAPDVPVGALDGVPPLPDIGFPTARRGRIDLVGITLEVLGPHPTRANPVGGIDRLLAVSAALGTGDKDSGVNQPVTPGGDTLLDGLVAPDRWLVEPHAASDGSLSAAEVRSIIEEGVAEADLVRAAIRLEGPDFRPGARTRMVFAVTDKTGEVLGLFRMPDATIFSIDVSVAKARNVAYYADAAAIEDADLIFETDPGGSPDVPRGTAFTNRTFRFLVDARFPTGAEETLPGPFSMLNDPGIDPRTAENVGPPLAASVYGSSTSSVGAFDAFRPATNFRDPDDPENQNGVVFFPGSSPLYTSGSLAGGFGVSGDGVDQDDVVTVAGQDGFEPAPAIRADMFFLRDVRLPYQKFLRNPLG